jgi:hypothetical protein
LAKQVTNFDNNLFNIQRAFFPPQDNSPVYVTVKYTFSDNITDAENETWYWSTATFYFFQPLNIFQFTSLLFSDTSLHSGEVQLTLPLQCADAHVNHMELLTQRVCFV